MEYKQHELARLFPPLLDEEFELLMEDIRQNDQREPIVVFEGKILEGWHRYRACRELGIEPITRQWDGTGSAIDFVMSANFCRRHLTVGQRAMIAARADTIRHEAEEHAKARQRLGAKQGGETAGRGRPKADDSFREKLPEGKRALDEVAERFAVSARSLRKAIDLDQADRELAGKVWGGVTSLNAAVREARFRKAVATIGATPGLDPQVAQQIVKLPIAEKDYEVRRLAELGPEDQIAVVREILHGEARTVTEGIIAANSVCSTNKPIPIDPREAARADGRGLLRRMREVIETLGCLDDYKQPLDTFAELFAERADTGESAGESGVEEDEADDILEISDDILEISGDELEMSDDELDGPDGDLPDLGVLLRQR